MIIPVRCFTCGMVIGSKYDAYVKEMNKYLDYGEDYDPQQRNPELKNFNNSKIIIPEKAEDLYEYLFTQGADIEEHDLKYVSFDDKTSSWDTLEHAQQRDKVSFKTDISLKNGMKIQEVSEDMKYFKTNERWFKNKKVKNKQMRIFDKLGVKRYCCKRHLLTHVDLINIID
jgi:DNA-directed RNA polymerase subunit N (RpoN/RPB10)